MRLPFFGSVQESLEEIVRRVGDGRVVSLDGASLKFVVEVTALCTTVVIVRQTREVPGVSHSVQRYFRSHRACKHEQITYRSLSIGVGGLNRARLATSTIIVVNTDMPGGVNRGPPFQELDASFQRV